MINKRIGIIKHYSVLKQMLSIVENLRPEVNSVYCDCLKLFTFINNSFKASVKL